MNAPEKREFPRVEASLTVDMRTKYIYTMASVINVSPNGLFIKTQNCLPEGSELELVAHVATRKKPFRFKGVVRWVRHKPVGSLPMGMGIQLMVPDVQHMKRFLAAVRHSPKSF
jgi:uncharacterized protein (TIGR02266 family)